MATKEGWLVADSDMHVMEPADLWQRYIDPLWAHAAPVGLNEIERDMRVRVKNAVLLRLGRTSAREKGRPWRADQDSAFAHAEERDWDAKSQVMAMDMEGIDSTVLFPSRGLFVLSLQSSEHIGPDGMDPGLSSAIARAYNDWMFDFVCDTERSDRVFGSAMIAPHDVGAAVDELARNVERGFKAGFLVPGLVDNKPWHHPIYDPLWREAERLGVPICFHGGGTTYLKPDFAFSEHLDKLMLWHPFNQPLGIMFVVTCFTSGGILRAFPSAESGASRRQLLMGAVHDVPPRRALGVDRQVRGTGTSDGAIAVLPAQLLRFVRGRRSGGQALLRGLRRRQRRLLDRLPARRLQVPARHRVVPRAPVRGVHQAQDPVGQLLQALRHHRGGGLT